MCARGYGTRASGPAVHGWPHMRSPGALPPTRAHLPRAGCPSTPLPWPCLANPPSPHHAISITAGVSGVACGSHGVRGAEARAGPGLLHVGPAGDVVGRDEHVPGRGRGAPVRRAGRGRVPHPGDVRRLGRGLLRLLRVRGAPRPVRGAEARAYRLSSDPIPCRHRIPFRVCRPGWPLGAGASGARSREPARAVRERGRRQLDSSGAPGGPVQREDQLRGGARSTASRAARGQGFPPLCVCSRILPQQLSCTAGVPGAQLPGGGEPLCVPGPGPPGPHPGGPR